MSDLGALRERLVLKQKTATTDTQGGRSLAWSTVATVWGSMRPLAPREQLQAETIGAHLTYEAEIRYRADVTPLWRLQWRPYAATAARTFEIAGVVPKAGRPERLLLTCAEVQ